MIEFAIVALIALSVILAIIDFSRYFALKALLNKSAQEGLSLAQRMPDFNLDVTGIDPEKSPEGKELYERFVSARNAVFRRATRLIGTTIPNQPLYRAFTVDPIVGDGLRRDTQLAPVQAIHALVLRPGESAIVAVPTQDCINDDWKKPECLRWVDHPQVCLPQSPTCIADENDPEKEPRPRNASESMKNLLRDYPILVELRTDLDFYTPWVGSLPVSGRALGFRENFPGSTFNAPGLGEDEGPDPFTSPFGTPPAPPGENADPSDEDPNCPTCSDCAAQSSLGVLGCQCGNSDDAIANCSSGGAG